MTKLEQAIMDVIRATMDFDLIAIEVFHMTEEEVKELRDFLVFEREEKCDQSQIMQKVFDLVRTDPVQYATPWINKFNLATDKKENEYMEMRRKQDKSIAYRRATVAHLEALIQ